MKGSTWHRWDLHYHTPSSYDHHNKSKTNQEIVDELLADNVSAVVISDHHRIDFSRINLKSNYKYITTFNRVF